MGYSDRPAAESDRKLERILDVSARQVARLVELVNNLLDVARKPSGLGLGLYITRQIIQGHHGGIRVESEPGQGSEFIVDLPIEQGSRLRVDLAPSVPAQALSKS